MTLGHRTEESCLSIISLCGPGCVLLFHDAAQAPEHCGSAIFPRAYCDAVGIRDILNMPTGIYQK